MPTKTTLARLSFALALSLAGFCLTACSGGGGSNFESDYVSPIASSPKPEPTVPTVSGGKPQRQMPLLPPVPGDEASNGLPPVRAASLMPPVH